MTAITWTATPFSNWDVPASWSGSVLPTVGDDVFLSADLGGTYTSLMNTTAEIASLTISISAAQLVWNFIGTTAVGKLTVDGATTVTAGTLDLSDTSLSGSSLTTGSLLVSGGSFITGQTVTVNGLAEFSGGSVQIIGGSVLAGTTNVDAPITLGGTLEVINSATISATGSVALDSATAEFGSALSGIVNDGDISGFGVVTNFLGLPGFLTGTGTVTATGGTLELDGTIAAGSGQTFDIGASSASDVMLLDKSPGTGNTFTFVGSVGNLALANGVVFNDTIAGLNVGTDTTPTNFVDILGNSGVTVDTGQTGTGTSGTFTLSNGDTFSLTGITNSPAGNWFVNTASDGAGGTDVFLTLCFTHGTCIATPRGEIPVEQLSVGDEVVTRSGKVRPITWIGTGCVLSTRGRRTAATPVIIRKGAIADNEPHHDLRVTKGHSLYIDRVLIPVEFLVNHRSILWDDRAQEVSIYHIELEDHEVLIANGTAAESYRDDGNRWLFRNANVAWSFPPKEPCAPVLTGGPVVDAIWQRLLERSGTRPGFPLTDDPGLHLLVDGQRVDPRMATPDGRYVFRLQAPPDYVRIVSRAGAPSELGLSRDPRPLGIAVRRIAILDGIAQRIVEAADTALRDGFHGYEPGEDIRWTNGNAGLPADLFSACSGPLDIEITTAGATRYLDEGVPLAA